MSAPQSFPTTSGCLVGEKYRLEERLGEGAVGVVYRAVHVGLEKSFAIKLLKTAGAPDRAALERFRREAVALGRLRHPHIVEVTDSGIDEVPYIVTELLEGKPLSDLCRDQGPLPLAQALPLLAQIADAIDAAHRADVLHRDLKPGNVFVCESGAVKVLDFGLAELLTGPGGTRGAAEETLGSMGTPLYAAPELIGRRETSRASDVYSFGVLAYEMLGGKPPFQGSVAEVLVNHLTTEPPPLPLPQEIWHALREALHKDPAFRPRTAGEVVRRLREGAAKAEWARWK
ncbi:MAG TPA: serine/threonine-protein kinase, partial [Thermoanaerobaculia bacterium]